MPRVLIFAFLASVVTGIVCGLAPVMQTRQIPLMASLKERSRAGLPGGVRVRKLLVIGQLAFTLILLIGAGLFVKTVARLHERVGFASDNLVMVGVNPYGIGYTLEDAERAMREVDRRLRELPVIERVAAANHRRGEGLQPPQPARRGSRTGVPALLGPRLGRWHVLRARPRRRRGRVRLDPWRDCADRSGDARDAPDVRRSDRSVAAQRADAGHAVERVRRARAAARDRRRLRRDVVRGHAAHTGDRRAAGARRDAICCGVARRARRADHDCRGCDGGDSRRGGLETLVEAQLFGVRAFDAPTIVLATGVLALVALAAAMIPAWRAASVSPTEALRLE